MSRSGDGAGVAGLKLASEKLPSTSSTAHQRPACASTITTVGFPRANASARAVRRVARKSPEPEAKLPRDLSLFSAMTDMPARTAMTPTTVITSTIVNPRARFIFLAPPKVGGESKKAAAHKVPVSLAAHPLPPVEGPLHFSNADKKCRSAGLWDQEGGFIRTSEG